MIHTMKYDAVRARVCELTEEQKGISLECIDKALEGLGLWREGHTPKTPKSETETQNGKESAPNEERAHSLERIRNKRKVN